MPATRGRRQQAFDQSPALKPESSVKTRTKRYPKISVKPTIRNACSREGVVCDWFRVGGPPGQ